MSLGKGITAIVLNYARLENVKAITAHLCSEQLRDVIHHVIIWNNNIDHPISDKDFEYCLPDGMLNIINAPSNLYFQARFLACIEAPTELCLVQDDDYLVSSEAIRALRMYSELTQSSSNQNPIHLLPPHEHLSTTLRTRKMDKYIASFAWLGHGTLLTRTCARSFISLLRTLSDNREDVMKMADNFFSILLNRPAEIWLDPGTHFEAGREEAFTVGAEGDERNWHYIQLAEAYLEHIVSQHRIIPEKELDAFATAPFWDGELITRAPVLAPGRIGLWSTNIPMLPPGTIEAGSAAKDLRSADQMSRALITNTDYKRYTQHSLACIGDGIASTIFRSPGGCQEGQWVRFDFLDRRQASSVTFKWRIEPEFISEIERMTYDALAENEGWIKMNIQQIEPVDDGSCTTCLALACPTSLIAVRASVGPGSATRPAWGVIECLVDAA